MLKPEPAKFTPAPDGSLMPKHDENGRMYRELRCPYCHSFIIDEFIRVGRVRFRCPNPHCGRIGIMEFRPQRSKRSNTSGNKKKE